MGQEGGSSDTVDKLTEVQKKVREIDWKGAPDKRGGGARVGVRQEREGGRVPISGGRERFLAFDTIIDNSDHVLSVAIR